MSRRDRIRKKIAERCERDPVTGCLIWTGPTSGESGRGRGYPRMALDGQTVAVHIAQWTNEHGLIPGKKTLDHVCRNRLCVQDERDPIVGNLHCEMVTHKENCKRRDQANGIVRKKKRKARTGRVGKSGQDTARSKRPLFQEKDRDDEPRTTYDATAGSKPPSRALGRNAGKPGAAHGRVEGRKKAPRARHLVGIGEADRPAPPYTIEDRL